MIGAFGPANVIDRYMGHYLLHAGKLFQAGGAVFELLASLSRQQRLRIDGRL